MKTVITAAALVAISGAASAGSETIAAWGLFGQPGDQAFTAATSSASNVAGDNMTRGAGLAGNVGNNSFNSAGWNGLDANDYVAFGFTVDAGYSVDLESLIIGTRSSNSGPGDLGLFYSGDGFSSSLFTFTQDSTNFLNSVVDLSGLTGLTGNVEFRIAALSDTRADGSTGISSQGTFRIVDFFDNGDFIDTQFTGTVVPTPGAIALFGAAGLAASRRRRA